MHHGNYFIIECITNLQERMHLAELFRATSYDGCNIFAEFPAATQVEIRKLIINMVLATDLSRHFIHVGKLRSKKYAVSAESKGVDLSTVMETLLMLSDLGTVQFV